MTEIAGAGVANVIYMPNVHGSIGFALPGLEARVASVEDAWRDRPQTANRAN